MSEHNLLQHNESMNKNKNINNSQRSVLSRYTISRHDTSQRRDSNDGVVKIEQMNVAGDLDNNPVDQQAGAEEQQAILIVEDIIHYRPKC